MRTLLALTLVLSVLFVAYPVWAQDAKPLEILRFTPQGDDVEAGRQLVVEFNRAVVPVGRMDRTAEEVGIETMPALNCHWRWINISTLACNLDGEDGLQQSTAYSVKVGQLIKAEDGAGLAQSHAYKFITQRADVSYYNFQTWRSASIPVIRVVFNQPVTRDSVTAHMNFRATAGKGLRQLVTVSPDPDDNNPVENVSGAEARRIWLVEPREPLPAESNVALALEPGLISAAGTAPSVAVRDIVTFDTYPEFRFAGVRCSNNAGIEVLIEPGKKQTEEQLCNPMRPAALTFSVPVLRSEVKDNIAMTPDLGGGKPGYNPWGDENRDWSGLGYPHEKGKVYYVGFPVGLKAAQQYTLSVPAKKPGLKTAIAQLLGKDVKEGMQDEFGRTLMKPVKLVFSTAHRPPNFELVYKEAVLEKNIDSEVPLYVNNLKSYTLDYRRLSAAGVTDQQTFNQSVPTPEDVQFAVPLGVRTMLEGKSGVVYGHLQTDPVKPQYLRDASRLFAQVTPFQLHFKLGHFQSIAWVTDLATGQPVEGANVTLYKDELADMSLPSDPVGVAVTDKDGMAVLPGTAEADPDNTLTQAWREEDLRLFVRIDKGEDMALMPLGYDFFIDTWRASNETIWASNERKYGHMKSWGMTAQGVYRAGDTMQYKIFLRDQDNLTLVPPPEAVYSLEIFDPTGKSVLKQEGISFSEFGAYAAEYAIPKNAAVGWYNFELSAKFSEEDVRTFQPLRVLVSDFTPAYFRVTSQMNGDHFKAGDNVDLHADAKMHAGGAYTDVAVRMTGIVKSRRFESKNPIAQGFVFDSFQEGRDSEQIFQKDDKLDDNGEWNEKFTLPAINIAYGVLELEAAVPDDRGKTIANVSKADYFSVDRLVGMKSPEWIYEAKKPASFPVLVVDDKGNPVAGTTVKVAIEYEFVNTARVKGAGNAYLSDITTEWKHVSTCDQTSTLEPQDCTFTPEAAGTYRLIASVTDTKGVAHKTTLHIWASGDDYVQWNTEGDTALPIVPEKTEYRIGDTARYLIKNPYPGAKALVTIERYGVMDSFVTTLEGSTPTIEFPVKPDYMPGYYLSVVVVSPRVEAPPAEEGQVDLGKPTFRMGYVTVPVKDPVKEMQVDVKVAQDVYRPRDKVKLDLTAVPRLAQEGKEPVELTVAVLDEAVFDLISSGRKAFDPYEGFYSLDNLDLRNYSLLTRLVGRQKFEKKGANPGGDGGADIDMRTLFKYVSYWNPALKTDENGKATVEFEAPDNLTGWRVLVLATTPGDRMGLGEGNFKVNRPTEVRPVMPNQVREGDEFTAGFSVMNRTDAPRTIRVVIEAEGNLKGEPKAVKTEEVTLESYKRATVYMNLTADMLPIKGDAPEGAVKFKATVADDTDSDGTVYTLPVLKSRTVDIAATYGTTSDAKVQENISFPEGIYTDTGDVSVVLSPSVIANLEGAFRYMRDYSYTCWEQSLTRAVMASRFNQLKSYLPDTLTWEGSDTVPQEMLDRAADFQAPSGGMTYFTPRDDYADPYLSAYTALAFRWLADAGYKVPESVETKLQDYLLNFLKQDAAPSFYQEGMTSTVRAVALAALVDAGKVGKDDVLRYELHVQKMSLFGKAQFMQAAIKAGGLEAETRKVADMIFSAANESGGKFTFSETLDNGYARILATPLRDNCAVLDTLMDYADSVGADLVGDKPFKLVRMITQARGNRDHWENTQENVFCMSALEKYARRYESEKPNMTVSASLGGSDMGKTTFASVKDEAKTLSKPIAEGDSGRQTALDITREGVGRLYYATRLRYALTSGFDKEMNAGIEIHREYHVQRDGSWVLLKDQEAIKRGDLVKVDLYLNVPSARNFVVVDDPLPGGLETVNTDLATASAVDAQPAEYDREGGSFWFKFGDWRGYGFSRWSFYHRELRHDSARFYSDWIDAGNYHLSYVAQAIAGGAFNAPAARAQEMYDPDVYGRTLGYRLNVKTE